MTTARESAKIRSYIYADEYLLYSLSSQLFRGFTESITESRTDRESATEEQKGPLWSGNFLSDLTSREAHTEERRVLFDHAYSLLEHELYAKELILDVASTTDPRTIAGARLVKVTGKAVINDVDAIAEFMEQYNSIGQALAFAQTHEQRSQVTDQAQTALESTKDRNEKARIRKQLKSLTDISNLAKSMNLQIDDELLRSLVLLIRRGYGNGVELEIHPEDFAGTHRFTALLDKEYFRRDTNSLIRKYSRRTQAQFSVIGIVTRVGENLLPATEGHDSTEHEPTLRNALLNIAHSLADVEDTFVGAHKDEIILDPIVVYREL